MNREWRRLLDVIRTPVVPWKRGWSRQALNLRQRRVWQNHEREIRLSWAIYRCLGQPPLFYRPEKSPECFWEEGWISMPPPVHYTEPKLFFSDLFHELGHWLADKAGRASRKDAQAEFAAEAVGFLLCSLVGFDVVEYSGRYFQRHLTKFRIPRSKWSTCLSQARKLAQDLIKWSPPCVLSS